MGVITNEIELGAHLRARRQQAGLTQGRLAERAGVSRAFVLDLERGRRPRAELYRVLAVMRALEAAIELVEHREQSSDDILAELLGSSHFRGEQDLQDPPDPQDLTDLPQRPGKRPA